MSTQKLYPPVVSVLGHVDHGKTSLLDAIRKTSVANREHGGITQKIGASSVEIVHDGQKQRITFIDTPGHEAFSNMRGRGAQVADIGILVVSAVDGVMPQTKESIELLKNAGIPFIVALTKSDLLDKNIEKVKQQLAKEEILLEGYGGDVPVIEVSAKTNTNVKELLDLILLVQEMKQPEKVVSETNPLLAIVIESKLDPKTGSKATIVVKDGTMSVKDDVIAGTVSGRIRALMTDEGALVKSATVGDAIEVLGFEGVPPVGSVVKKSLTEQMNQEQVVEKPKEKLIDEAVDTLSLILCADTQGALEAIMYALPEKIRLMAKKTGEISEADVLMAKSTGAIILCFNTKIRPDVAKFALTEKVLLKNYAIIYELLDELKEVMEGKALAGLEQIFGTAKIQASFPFEKTQVLGIKVMDGRVARGDKVRLMRGEETIGESTLVSLRQGKETTSKIEKGQEGGVLISPFLDFRVGDVIISHS
ncbi:MAG: translation initiation factor IF-2 [Candidatus Levyibacteriota bacterium]